MESCNYVLKIMHWFDCKGWAIKMLVICNGISFSLNTDVGEIGSHLAISIAIPLLLFSANLKEAKKLSKTVLKSFGSLIFSTVFVATITFYIYGHFPTSDF